LKQHTGTGQIATLPGVYLPTNDSKFIFTMLDYVKEEIGPTVENVLRLKRDTIRIYVIGPGTGVDAMATYRMVKEYVKGLSHEQELKVELYANDSNPDAVKTTRFNMDHFYDITGDSVSVFEADSFPDEMPAQLFDIILFHSNNPTLADEIAEARAELDEDSFRRYMSIRIEEEEFKKYLRQISSRLAMTGVAFVGSLYSFYDETGLVTIQDPKWGLIPESLKIADFVSGIGEEFRIGLVGSNRRAVYKLVTNAKASSAGRQLVFEDIASSGLEQELFELKEKIGWLLDKRREREADEAIGTFEVFMREELGIDPDYRGKDIPESAKNIMHELNDFLISRRYILANQDGFTHGRAFVMFAVNMDKSRYIHIFNDLIPAYYTERQVTRLDNGKVLDSIGTNSQYPGHVYFIIFSNAIEKIHIRNIRVLLGDASPRIFKSSRYPQDVLDEIEDSLRGVLREEARQTQNDPAEAMERAALDHEIEHMVRRIMLMKRLKAPQSAIVDEVLVRLHSMRTAEILAYFLIGIIKSAISGEDHNQQVLKWLSGHNTTEEALLWLSERLAESPTSSSLKGLANEAYERSEKVWKVYHGYLGPAREVFYESIHKGEPGAIKASSAGGNSLTIEEATIAIEENALNYFGEARTQRYIEAYRRARQRYIENTGREPQTPDDVMVNAEYEYRLFIEAQAEASNPSFKEQGKGLFEAFYAGQIDPQGAQELVNILTAPSSRLYYGAEGSLANLEECLTEYYNPQGAETVPRIGIKIEKVRFKDLDIEMRRDIIRKTTDYIQFEEEDVGERIADALDKPETLQKLYRISRYKRVLDNINHLLSGNAEVACMVISRGPITHRVPIITLPFGKELEQGSKSRGFAEDIRGSFNRVVGMYVVVD
ncbi:MAG: hypothetical protein HQ572_02645, partial [Candidatus Omnitrophica bacterium]|nr:hypothetical protein [Candidatus Omnitrophota bacterium]